MKSIKKSLALIVALIMALSVCTTAFAGSASTITVDNASNGKKYQNYKVFDLTFSGESNVAYIYKGSNSTFITNLKASTSPFTVAQNSEGFYNVELKASKTLADVTAFLKDNVANLGTADEKTASGGTAVFDVTPGYYYITTETGSAVTIENVKGANVTVHDKNQAPTPGDNGLKNIVDTTGALVKEASANYGDTVKWQLQANATNFDGEKLITKYEFIDEFTGFKDFKVTKVNVKSKGDLTVTTDYTVSGGTITIPWAADGVSKYAANDVITISCEGTVIALDSDKNKHTNKATLKWYDANGPIPNEPPSEDVDTYTYNVTPKAVDKTTKAELTDAKYVLKNKDGKYYKLDNGKVTWVEKANADVKPSSGTFAGVESGKYEIEEQTAPNGYKPLTALVDATVDKADKNVDVEYEPGKLLPKTGGMGTTVFMLGGIALMAAAAFVAISKKKSV